MPVVSCFAGSAPALERLELGGGPGRWLESLAALRPELALEPDGAVLSTWDDDPWVGAAYSVSPRPRSPRRSRSRSARSRSRASTPRARTTP